MFSVLFMTAGLTAGQAGPVASPAALQPEPPAAREPLNLTVTVPPPAPAAEATPAAAAAATRWPFMLAVQGTWLGVLLDDNRTTVSGWTEMSYTASTTSKSNLPVAFNDQANKFQMNQNLVRIDRPTDPTRPDTQFGYRAEIILPGTDARFTIPRGLLDSQLHSSKGVPLYPIDLYVIYGEAFLPDVGPRGTTVRVGRFATHCEYEVTEGPETPFLSRSYLFQYNPFTHTGVWAISQLDDTWTVSNGVVLGSDNFIDPASRPTYIGQLKWAPKGGSTTALLNVVVTDPRYDVAEAFPFYNVYNFQLTHKFNDRLTYVLDSTFSHMDGIPDVGSAVWYGAANYLLYQVTPTVASNLRVELFEDQKGVRTGFAGLYFEAIYGVTWSPRNWLLVRPFARFDYNGDSRPFEGDHHLVTAGMDLIVRW